MSTPPPPPSTAPSPAPAPRATPPVPAKPAPPPPPPRSGPIADRGVVRHDAVHTVRWTVDGTAKVIAETDAGTLEARGTVVVGGPLTADSGRVTGSLDVGGAVEVASTLVVDGHLRARSPVHAGDLELKGTARCAGDVRVDRTVSVRGTLTVPNLRGTDVDLEGATHIRGDVEATRVEARFEQDSEIGRILARSVRLRGRVPSLVDKAFFRHAIVTVDRIEADRVELEAVTVLFVRAPEIVLGREASVAEVEGKIVRRHPSSHLGPESKSPPPYGLRR